MIDNEGTMKKAMSILVLLLIVTILSALPKELTRSGNPELYKEFSKKARVNLKQLQYKQKEAYQKMLKEHPDVLMCYLIAYECDANLAAADPEDIESNYQTICALVNKEGLKYKPEFFLSYIAKQTVSDEAITAYRKAMLKDGLQNIINTTHNDIDRFRAVTLWCVSRLQFQQTSGRDQTPLDIIHKSIIGRCEEMQILLVAAARTVGLPSRPASVPWWAHIDNNHAWTEIFLDGEWHYTGDMDMAYFPDQTWFSGLVDKTVMILAEGSLATWDDEVLAKGKYETLINSTRNYTKERSRTIKLKVINENGKPVTNAYVIPMVFNWGSLRALTVLTTNKNGYLQFTAGRGAFYLSVYSKDGKALILVPSNEKTNVELTAKLDNNDFPGGWATLEYPGNIHNWQTQPEEYTLAVNLEKQLWQEKQKVFETNAIKAKVKDDSLMIKVAIACRGNFTAFWDFVKRNPTPEASFLEFLLLGDPKFLWQAKAEQFEALYENWIRLQDPDIDEENTLSLFSSSVFYEDLPEPIEYVKGKAQLYPKAFRFNYPHNREGAIKVLSKLKQKYKIKPEKALSGLPPLHIAIEHKYLTPVQYRIMAVYILRANGFPAEFSRIPNLVAVFIDGDWQYVNIVKLSWEDRSKDDKASTFHCTLQINDTDNNPIKVEEEQLTLCRYENGMFYPLNVNFDYLGSGKYTGIFPVYETWLQFGYRVSDSKTKFYYQQIKPNIDDVIHLEIIAEEYPRKWEAADSELIALLDDIQNSENKIILIGNYDQENSRRLADKLISLKKDFVWLGYSTSETAPHNYILSNKWNSMVRENTHNAMRSITLIKIGETWQMYDGLWDKLPD